MKLKLSAPFTHKILTLTVLLVTGATQVACVTPDNSLYRWGDYEEIIYQGYKNPGESDPLTDATLLAEDVERTQAEGRTVPPGVRIHLGYLYFNQGRTDEAQALFEQERALFPESKAFVDGLLQRMGQQ